MPINISPLDDDFIKLGRVARLMADEDPTIEYEDVMDMFTRAIFSGALEPPPLRTYSDEELAERNKLRYWLQVLINSPKGRVTDAQRAIHPRPSEYYGAGRDTIISVMHCDEALPGDNKQWDKFLEFMGPRDEAYGALVRLHFNDYPEHGRKLLEDIRAPKIKLRKWFELRKKPVPWFLKPKDSNANSSKANGVESRAAEQESVIKDSSQEIVAPETKPNGAAQGRPKKPAWVFIESVVRSLHREFPTKRKKEIAFDVWKLAKEKFDEEEVPSATTIQRKMGEILAGK